MIKECLNILIENNYNEVTLRPTVKHLVENFDDDQLIYLAQNGGLKISADIILTFHYGIGFRCYNNNAHIIGNKPICGVIERALNNKYKLLS
ncbi:MAG: hypothetical protein HPY57_13365 [Ignavibacteria bacterium]|nr:hypothetical protein [Ignavibacteria bacterium]